MTEISINNLALIVAHSSDLSAAFIDLQGAMFARSRKTKPILFVIAMF